MIRPPFSDSAPLPDALFSIEREPVSKSWVAKAMGWLEGWAWRDLTPNGQDARKAAQAWEREQVRVAWLRLGDALCATGAGMEAALHRFMVEQGYPSSE